MANYKKITAAYTTGATVYCIVSRDADDYFLAGNKASFTASVAYPGLTEDANIKGLYVLNTNDVAWDDGTYTIVVYVLTGATATPASDIMVAYGSMQIEDDLEVQKFAVTNVTNGVTLADDAITSAKFDETTAFPLKSADTGTTAVARTGADSDTLETLSDQIDGIPSSPSAGDIADAVWDEARSGHTTDGSFGQGVASVTGAVGSVTNDVGITQGGADKVWSSAARSLTDKVGFALSSAGALAVWEVLLSSITAVGSIGKKLADWVLGSDNKVLLSTDAQSGVTIPTVTNLTNAPTSGDFTDTMKTFLGSSTGLTQQQVRDAMRLVSAVTIVEGSLEDKIDAIQARTDLVPDSPPSVADVKDQVVAALITDTYNEPAAVPAATSSLKDKLAWLFALARNKIIQTSTSQQLQNDADATSIASADVSDDGSTFTRDKWSS